MPAEPDLRRAPAGGPRPARPDAASLALLLPPLLGTVWVLAASLNEYAGFGLASGVVMGLAVLGTALALPLVMYPASWAAVGALAGAFAAVIRYGRGTPGRLSTAAWVPLRGLVPAFRQALAQGPLLLDRPQALWVLGLWCALLGLAFSDRVLRRRDPMSVLILGVLALTLEWVFYFDRAPGYLGWHLCAGMALVAAGNVWARKAVWRERGVREQRFNPWPGLGSAMLAAFLLVAGSGLMPHQVRPFNWQRAGEVLTDIFPVLERARGAEGVEAQAFTLGTVGLGGRAERLGGPSTPGQDQVLWVRSWGDYPYATLYLRGVARDLYTGQGWRRSGLRLVAQEGGLLESSLSPEVPVSRLTTEVEARALETPTLFCALEPARAEVAAGRYFADDTLTLLASSPIRQGHRYVTFARVPIVTREAVLARVPSGPAFAAALPPWTGRYLQLPDRLPPEVSEFATRATAGIAHPLDQALELERRLRELPYTLQAPQPPLGADFVEYFLFQARRGHCAYHSTALAVLLRCLGIPTRWVEGFVVTTAPGLQGGEAVAVRESNSHAWVEAYFPGWGWMTLEATPAYPVPDRNLPPPPAPALSPPSGPPVTGPGPRPAPEDLLPGDEWPGVPGPRAGRAWPWPWVGLGGGAAMLAGLGGWTAFMAAGARRRERLPEEARKDPGLQVRHYFALAEDRLRRCGLPRAAGRTPLEFARWAAPTLGPQASPKLSALAALYSRTRYGPAPAPGRTGAVDAADADQARCHCQGLEAWARRRWGWLGYQRRRLFGPPKGSRWEGERTP